MACVTTEPLLPPSPRFPLGTDPLGRDALCAFLSSLPNTLLAQATAISVSATFLVVVVLSLISERSEKLADFVLELLNGFPRLPLFVFLSLITSLTPFQVGLLIGLLASVRYAMGLMERAKEIVREEFSLASFASGADRLWVLRRHVLPHLWGLIVRSSLIVGAVAVQAEVGLGTLGLESPSSQGIGQLIYLLLTTPGALQTLAGLLQALTVSIAAASLSALPFALRSSLKPLRSKGR